MNSALELALERAESLEVIPKMTHPLSKHWPQPNRNEIEFTETKARMSQYVFDQLKNYSRSVPTGVYEGKMWKRGEPYFSPAKWFLCWYGVSKEPNKCSINYREIELV